MWATCRNAECANNGYPIDVGSLQYTDEEGVVHDVPNVACGPCGVPITDISETRPPDPEEPVEGAATPHLGAVYRTV